MHPESPDNGPIGIVRNPVAGSASARARWPAILAAFRGGFPAIDLRETSGPGQTARLARDLALAGADPVVAVGGDGTIGEAVDGLMAADAPARPAFSFVMQGTGSDFSRNFPGISHDETLPQALAHAPERPLDIGRLSFVDADGRGGTRHFVNIASFGVSGPTVRAVNAARRGRWLPGPVLFLWHAVMAILRYRPDRVRIRLDGEEIYSGGITVVAVANGAWFGGGMKVAPDADIADGWFDVVIVREKTTFGILSVMHRIYSGRHVIDPDVAIHRARLVEAEPLAGARPALLDCDGEAPGTIPARFEIVPAALRLKL